MTDDYHVAVMGRGICSCGRIFMIFPKDREDVAEILRKDIGDKWDIFITDGIEKEAHCSKCGQLITMPIPETLDLERHPFGRYLAKIAKEVNRDDDKTDATPSYV